MGLATSKHHLSHAYLTYSISSHTCSSTSSLSHVPAGKLVETLAISLQDGSVKQLPSQAMPAGQTALALLGVAKLIKGEPWKGLGALTQLGFRCAR